MRVAAPRGASRDRKVFVQSGYVSETAVGQAAFRGMDERPETPADGEIVENAILSQQRGASIQQFIENLTVGNPGMLGREKYELDRPVTQAAAELPRERRCLADAFVNNDPFDTLHDLIAFTASRGPRNRGDLHTCSHSILCHAAFLVLLTATAWAQIISTDFRAQGHLRLSLGRQVAFPAMPINGLKLCVSPRKPCVEIRKGLFDSLLQGR